MEPLVIVLIMVLGIAVGIAGGLYLGQRRGRAQLLAEQDEAAELAQAKAAKPGP